MSYYYIKPNETNEWIKPRIKDGREMLRAIIIGYTHECRSLKKTMKDTHGPLYGELFNTLKFDTQPSARAAMLAMRMIKEGTSPVDCIEDGTYTMPDMPQVRSFVEDFGSKEVIESINWDDLTCRWQQVVDNNNELYYQEDELTKVAAVG